MATNRPTTRRRSVKQAFDDDEAPAPKRSKTEVNGASKRANGAGATRPAKKAAKAAYDEDDDGFQFSRRTSRRVTKAPVSEPIPEHDVAKPARTVDAQPAKSTSRRKKTSIATIDEESSDSQKRRRSTRLSGDKKQLDARPQPTEPVAAKRTKKSVSAEKERKKQITPAPEAQSDAKGTFKGVQTPTQNELQVVKTRDPNAQRIMLPFADTPVITRNKEMRKGSKDGHRRSSTGLRGRRASSLIDSGMSNALPHTEIEARDFYKYIEQSLPEPRRMKQLLTWCGTRALPAKPSGDVKNANAIMAARAIQQELIDDFASKPELSDWFSREETVRPPVVKKPNPQNEKNQATLQELEDEVKRLEDEMAAWEALASTPTSMAPPPAPSIPTQTPTLTDIDASLLDPAQAAILSSLQLPPPPQQPQPHTASDPQPPLPQTSFTFTFTSPAALQTHLTHLASSLEPNIDLFADGVHKIEQYQRTAERVADRILGSAARTLDEREKETRERVGAEGIGVGDVLRGLAGVLADR
ncbi:kinetochore protein Mis13 [Cucurbitaria berberidis CBS 394.84]|uniref:Kinetochore protein Mis13 n=1 Tax=Cucurbitaria berberidis CBS 394.84 TaxID=1168544 RepID=A0A9P4GK83_9PLEO|nr:kinetochore protein Mis13 [Cucurbitaria berberidis CBS 394.84]KAF1846901.1 kinetochore protein Mis13 [Cucurbitaria berberidis CBS 394.84]